MIVIAGIVFLLGALPAIAGFRPDLRYPALTIIGGFTALELVTLTTSSTAEWVKPYLAQVVCPLLAGYIISEVIHGRKLRHTRGSER